MRKNLILLGVLAFTLIFSACTGSNKKEADVAYSEEEVKDANNIIKYYDASLALLKNMVIEKDVNAVLGYMEQGGIAPIIPAIAPPSVSQKDSADAVNPGDYIADNTRSNLIQNYAQLFQSRRKFYANFDKYLSYVKAKKNDEAGKLLDANYKLSIEMSECKQNIFDILIPVEEGAQKVLLADNPMKDQIIATKKIASTMQSIVNLYARKNVLDKARLDLKIVELKLQLETAGKLPVVNGQTEEMKKFKNFLSKAENFFNEVQKIRQKDSYADEDYETLNAYAVSVI